VYNYGLNETYWSGRYLAPNVESFIFRFYGRILKHDFGIDGKNSENVFDFGCGQGGALSFFNQLGFKVYGVDIAEKDLEIAKKSIPQTSRKSENFELISPNPKPGDLFFQELKLGNEWIDIAISIQTLDFLTDTDCQVVLKNIYNQMKPGGIIFASFNGTQNYYYNHSQLVEGGDGLRHVKFSNDRINYDLLLNFCSSEKEMLEKFSMFTPKYVDFYDSSFRNEGSEFRYTFCGVK